MQILNQLERKFGRFSVANLTGKLVLLQVIIFIIAQFKGPAVFSRQLSSLSFGAFNPLGDILGCLISPPVWNANGMNLVWLYFALYIFYMIGNTLEAHWGTFRYNLYILVYVCMHILLATCLRGSIGESAFIATNNLYWGVFFAFATILPNFEFLLFFILPVKVKVLGWIGGAFILLGVFNLFQDNGFSLGVLLLALITMIPILQYACFILPILKNRTVQTQRRRDFQKRMQKAAPEGQKEGGGFHKCVICGVTDVQQPELEFRVDADGQDRCENHLHD